MTDQGQGREATEGSEGTGPSALAHSEARAETQSMDVHQYAPERLSRKDCLTLLASGGLGRLAFSERALPAIAAVHFAVSDATLVLRVESGAEWAATQRHAVVAFQADLGDPFQAGSWTVTAVGRLIPVSDPAEVAALRVLPAWRYLTSAETFLRLDVQILEGTRNARVEPSSAASGL